LTGALIGLIGLPLVWRQYNLISPSSLVLNFFMGVPVIVAMYSGLATLAFGSLTPMIGQVCGYVCERSFACSEWMIESGRTWPGSYFWLPAPPGWWIALFYGGLGIAITLPPLRPRKHWLIALTLFWCAGALFLSQNTFARLLPRTNPPLVCHFVSVGHGLSVLVELPNGQALLYDAGRLGSPLAGVRPISAVLWQRGITHLDAIVISHADADHFNAIPGLLERFSVGAIYRTPPSASLRNLRGRATRGRTANQNRSAPSHAERRLRFRQRQQHRAPHRARR
jgi:competence protein ComEC